MSDQLHLKLGTFSAMKLLNGSVELREDIRSTSHAKVEYANGTVTRNDSIKGSEIVFTIPSKAVEALAEWLKKKKDNK